MTKINIGSVMGSTTADEVVGPELAKLYELFSEISYGSEVIRKLDYLHIVFLISGKHKDYESEGPEGLHKVRGHPELMVYCVMPEVKWRELNVMQIKEYLANNIRECIVLLLEKAEKSKNLIKKNEIIESVNVALEAFLKK